MMKVLCLIIISIFIISGCKVKKETITKEKEKTNEIITKEVKKNNRKERLNRRQDIYLKRELNGKKSYEIEIGKKYEQIQRRYGSGLFETFDNNRSILIFNEDNTLTITEKEETIEYAYDDNEINGTDMNYTYEFKDGLLYLIEKENTEYIHIYQITEK